MNLKKIIYVIIAMSTMILTSTNIVAQEYVDTDESQSFCVTSEYEDFDQKLYFRIISQEEKTVELIDYHIDKYTNKSSDVNINLPSEVVYNDVEYSVVGIFTHFGEPFIMKYYGVLTIPNGVKYIINRPFCYTSFSEINLPPTLTDLGPYAFFRPNYDQYGEYKESEPERYSIRNVYTPLIISNYIETIPNCAFNNYWFETVTVGRNVKKIEGGVFSEISNLYCCATTPPELESTKFLQYGRVWVPKGCKDIYKQNESWSVAPIISEYDYYVDVKFKDGVEGKILKGSTRELHPKITWLHEGSSERYRTWTSSDETVATVNQDGVITAHDYGNANITFTIEDERGIPFDCTFNVEVTDEAGITDILESDDADTAVEVFTLNGLKVGDSTDNLPAGFYIVKSAKEARKICIK